MTDELKVCSHLHRLQRLQNLCIVENEEDPTVLLIIPGIDGRNNKESLKLLKFLLCGAVGRGLVDNSVLDEALEEMVLLIQATSVSVIYTSTAKKACHSILSACANLIEYMPLVEDEDEVYLLSSAGRLWFHHSTWTLYDSIIVLNLQIDSQQARKMCDFKRMMLESVPSGSIIGMSIPIGYESVQVVDFMYFTSWWLITSINACPFFLVSKRETFISLYQANWIMWLNIWLLSCVGCWKLAPVPVFRPRQFDLSVWILHFKIRSCGPQWIFECKSKKQWGSSRGKIKMQYQYLIYHLSL